MKKLYTVSKGLRGSVALLFGGEDIKATEIDVEAIRKDPGVNNLFPSGFFLHFVSDKNPRRYRGWSRTPEAQNDLPTALLVTTDMPADLEPDTAALDTEGLRFNHNGTEVTVSLRQRYNQCLSLFKATGCSTCPDRGPVCMEEAMEQQLGRVLHVDGLTRVRGEGFGNNLDAEDLIPQLTKNKTNLGGHDFVTPSLTRERSFSEVFRDYWEHDFGAVETNIKEFSDRGTRAAKTRKFKKEQCSKCLIKPACDNARWCKGPLPPENEIIEKCNAALDEVIKNSPLPEWQIWELARGMGNEAKFSRWQIYLCGVEFKQGHLIPLMSRRKVSIVDFRHPKLQTYDELAEVFGLAKDHTKAKGRVQDPKLRAIWWMALQKLGYGGHGWGRSTLLAAGCDDREVSLQWAKPRYLSYGGSLKEFKDVTSHITRATLPEIEHVHVR